MSEFSYKKTVKPLVTQDVSPDKGLLNQAKMINNMAETIQSSANTLYQRQQKIDMEEAVEQAQVDKLNGVKRDNYAFDGKVNDAYMKTSALLYAGDAEVEADTALQAMMVKAKEEGVSPQLFTKMANEMGAGVLESAPEEIRKPLAQKMLNRINSYSMQYNQDYAGIMTAKNQKKISYQMMKRGESFNLGLGQYNSENPNVRSAGRAKMMTDIATVQEQIAHAESIGDWGIAEKQNIALKKMKSDLIANHFNNSPDQAKDLEAFMKAGKLPREVADILGQDYITLDENERTQMLNTMQVQDSYLKAQRAEAENIVKKEWMDKGNKEINMLLGGSPEERELALANLKELHENPDVPVATKINIEKQLRYLQDENIARTQSDVKSYTKLIQKYHEGTLTADAVTEQMDLKMLSMSDYKDLFNKASNPRVNPYEGNYGQNVKRRIETLLPKINDPHGIDLNIAVKNEQVMRVRNLVHGELVDALEDGELQPNSKELMMKADELSRYYQAIMPTNVDFVSAEKSKDRDVHNAIMRGAKDFTVRHRDARIELERKEIDADSFIRTHEVDSIEKLNELIKLKKVSPENAQLLSYWVNVAGERNKLTKQHYSEIKARKRTEQ